MADRAARERLPRPRTRIKDQARTRGGIGMTDGDREDPDGTPRERDLAPETRRCLNNDVPEAVGMFGKEGLVEPRGVEPLTS